MTMTGERPLRLPFWPSGGPDRVEAANAELRRRAPVWRVELPYGEQAWLVVSYAEGAVVLSDPRFSRSARVGRDLPRKSPFRRREAGLLVLDPPEHTRLRRLVAQAFNPRRVERLRPAVERISLGLLGDMFAAGRPADLAASYCAQLPLAVLCELLGVPGRDWRQIRAWADAMLPTAGVPKDQLYQTYIEIGSYANELIVDRRANPGEDLISALVQARDEHGKLTERELIELITNIVGAGFDTPARALANFGYVLLTHPGHWADLKRDPERIPSAVEELLRYMPVGNGFILSRVALEDTELGGQQIRAGDIVLVVGGNRDPNAFDDPDQLDFCRAPNPHLAFGHGPHYCLGARLARVELNVALEHWTSHLPGLRLAIPADEVPWKTDLLVPGPRALPVTW